MKSLFNIFSPALYYYPNQLLSIHKRGFEDSYLRQWHCIYLHNDIKHYLLLFISLFMNHKQKNAYQPYHAITIHIICELFCIFFAIHELIIGGQFQPAPLNLFDHYFHNRCWLHSICNIHLKWFINNRPVNARTHHDNSHIFYTSFWTQTNSHEVHILFPILIAVLYILHIWHPIDNRQAQKEVQDRRLCDCLNEHLHRHNPNFSLSFRDDSRLIISLCIIK